MCFNRQCCRRKPIRSSIARQRDIWTSLESTYEGCLISRPEKQVQVCRIKIHKHVTNAERVDTSDQTAP
ncbi:unnamed protein product [Linum trigynum]|uniref:Uncharacterized protein n=1 Tax=Linum trigynum TaxID=586398 RepID=A0AAV2EQI2_9ROSI